MVYTGKISAEKRALVWYIKEQSKASLRDIARKCNISKSSVARIYCQCSTSREKLPVIRTGRPRKIQERGVRALIRGLKLLQARKANVSVKKVVKESGLSFQMASHRTFNRYLNEKGYGYFQVRKKGLLTENDCKLRLKYARKMKRELAVNPDFYNHEVAFYLDGVSFVHKNNPTMSSLGQNTRVWRKKGEGLQFTAKGSKDLAGGRRLHIIVAIAYGKGVVLKETYEKMNGAFFASFIRNHFNNAFARAGPKKNGKRLFIMDNDPSQRSRAATTALEEIEAELHEIPPRSPDLNIIENIFHLLRRFLDEEAISQNITSETFAQFRERVLRALERFPSDIIDRTIASMGKRIDAVISSNGHRTKY